MKKFIIIMMALVVLVCANSVFAACLADINMGGSRITNLKGFEYKSTPDPTFQNYAVTRDYVDGLLTPIKVYWHGGDPVNSIFNTFGVSTLSRDLTNSAGYFYNAAATDPGLVRRFIIIQGEAYNPSHYAVKLLNNGSLIFDISGLQYKQHFSFKFDYNFGGEDPGNTNMIIGIKNSKIPGIDGYTDTNSGGFVLTFNPNTSVHSLYYTQNETSNYSALPIIGANIIQYEASIVQQIIRRATGWHTVQVDFHRMLASDNNSATFGGDMNQTFPSVDHYIISLWVDNINFRNYRINSQYISLPSSGAGLGNLISVKWTSATPGLYVRNVVIDSGMIPPN